MTGPPATETKDRHGGRDGPLLSRLSGGGPHAARTQRRAVFADATCTTEFCLFKTYRFKTCRARKPTASDMETQR